MRILFKAKGLYEKAKFVALTRRLTGIIYE